MTWIANRWYVAAWDSEVDRKPIARTICGEPVMLYRKLDRSVVAMRDACPHRLLPLSMGYKEGDSIRCRYHGLLLGADGCAEEMPVKSERVPRAVRAQLYPVVERHRFIWVWIGDPARANPDLVPDFWPCSAPGWTFDGGYSHIACDYRLVIDNLMDLSHETYVHQGSIGQHEILESPIETEVRGEDVFVRRWMPGIEPPPFWRDALRSAGPVDRWQVCQFVAPSSVLIDVGVAPVEAGATIDAHDAGVRGFVIDAMTPESEISTHYFWGMARNFDIDDAGFTARFKAQQGHVFDEDVDVLEAQQRSIDANPGLKLRGFSVDQGSVRARQIIRKLIAAEGGDGI
ncbi:aromatic ring-hydroxylating dioxygenase subunit alpha [Sphingosinithalassobacter sp. CS137]|uniref:aromatic ring-hydroxylating dioxygenase subunit alpha n=1 Tax=Sphingosinithalassobacter sp. CS137 TaxID=2762748 RepID=UPI00165E9E69|nr:aromatic ring-hydroxylating dioxygenase subunit alpha [Sphingosinithalassobacter sp. CS137]